MSSQRQAHGARRSAPPGAARLLAAAGLVALLGGMAAIVISSGSTSGSGTVALPPTTTTSKPKPKPKPAPVVIDVTGVGAYDPEGDQSENGSDAPLATDGNPVTAWKSERYRSTFSKTGVGLVVDAGRPVRASRVVVTTETPGYNAQVRVGDSPTGPFTAVSGSRATGERTAFVLKPRRGRYVMLWITSMPTTGAAAVNEIAVTAGG